MRIIDIPFTVNTVSIMRWFYTYLKDDTVYVWNPRERAFRILNYGKYGSNRRTVKLHPVHLAYLLLRFP